MKPASDSAQVACRVGLIRYSLSEDVNPIAVGPGNWIGERPTQILLGDSVDAEGGVEPLYTGTNREQDSASLDAASNNPVCLTGAHKSVISQLQGRDPETIVSKVDIPSAIGKDPEDRCHRRRAKAGMI
jgi:hypothetical protein